MASKYQFYAHVSLPSDHFYEWGVGFVNSEAIAKWGEVVADLEQHNYGFFNVATEHTSLRSTYIYGTNCHGFIHPMEITYHETLEQYHPNATLEMAKADAQKTLDRLMTFAKKVAEMCGMNGEPHANVVRLNKFGEDIDLV